MRALRRVSVGGRVCALWHVRVRATTCALCAIERDIAFPSCAATACLTAGGVMALFYCSHCRPFWQGITFNLLVHCVLNMRARQQDMVVGTRRSDARVYSAMIMNVRVCCLLFRVAVVAVAYLSPGV